MQAQIDIRNGAHGAPEATRGNGPLNDVVVIYNRVPKTASTSFVGLVYDLCKQNKYHVLHVNVTNNMHTLTLSNQVLCLFCTREKFTHPLAALSFHIITLSDSI